MSWRTEQSCDVFCRCFLSSKASVFWPCKKEEGVNYLILQLLLDSELPLDLSVFKPAFLLVESVDRVVAGLHEESRDVFVVFVVLEQGALFRFEFFSEVKSISR